MFQDGNFHGSRYNFDPLSNAEVFTVLQERRMRQIALIRQTRRAEDRRTEYALTRQTRLFAAATLVVSLIREQARLPRRGPTPVAWL